VTAEPVITVKPAITTSPPTAPTTNRTTLSEQPFRQEKLPEMSNDIERSPDNRRLAYSWTEDLVHWFVNVDGIQDGPFEYIGEIIFSPDSKRIAFSVRIEGQDYVLVDRVKSPAYQHVSKPEFSADSRHLAYNAKLMTGLSCVVLDNIEGKPYDGVYFEPTLFSQDGKHLAYMAEDHDQALVVLDEKEYPRYPNVSVPVLSPDSLHIAYQAIIDGYSYVVVIDGKESRPYKLSLRIPEKGAIVFSPNSQRVAFVGSNGNKTFVVVDGVEGTGYDFVDNLVFSPDSQQIGYTAFDGNRGFLVTDRTEGEKYNNVDSFLFSPDSRHIAYVAETGTQWLVVADGKEGRKWDTYHFMNLTLVFSPDSQYLAYAASRPGGRVCVAVKNGKETILHGNISGSPIFSPDSQHIAFVAIVPYTCLIVDGIEGQPYSSIFFDREPGLFSASNHLHYWAIKGDTVYIIEEQMN
jgi:Tol biopolymer transport system component